MHLLARSSWLLLAIGMLGNLTPTSAADPFEATLKPFLNEFCVACHNKDKASGDLDLGKYTSAAKLVEDFRQWEHVVTFVKKQEMPPSKAKQPSAQVRKQALAAMDAILMAEARRLAGDPGMVPPRRLTNAEYDNTIRDLTGVDIRPAKSFPVDPSSGEGFNNTGEALTLSPNLFKKYYGAAEFVSEHALLTTAGLKFAPHPVVTFADRQKYAEQAILRFYETHAVDYEKVFATLWLYKHRPESQRTVTLLAWTTQAGLSPKYALPLWEALEKPSTDPYFLAWLRGQWQKFPLPKNPQQPQLSEVKSAARSLSSDVAKLAKELGVKETPAIVANAGNGPIDHLARRRKTAGERGQFDPGNVSKISVKIPNLPEPTPANNADLKVSGEAFCRLFPNRFYFVDSTRGLSAGFHLIEGFFRDDLPLCRLVLSEAENAELDRLWAELHFATGIWEKMLRGFVFFERSERNFLKHADFDPFREEDPELVTDATLARFQEVYLKRSNVKLTGEDLARHPISVFFQEVRTGLKTHRLLLKQGEESHLKDLLQFAERAYRRPLTAVEWKKLESSYREICANPEHGTEVAVRATLTRILVSPHFCLHFQATPAGESVSVLPDLTLASRLSYFLWAGPPDSELLTLAQAGQLADSRTLTAQVRRMLRDPKVSRFALEFFGQWLGYRDFLTQETVNRQVFPSFDDGLKQAMFEEPTRLIAHLIQSDKPITALLDGNSTFVNKKLAAHYGVPFNGNLEDWQLVSGMHERGRAGVLGMAVFLTKNSQPQRTSPVKRGFWVVHKLLGEHIPPPPPNVAVLPAKETDTQGKTIRQLLALHVEDAKCAGCHQRFDGIGLAMEGFDPIGKSRTIDLAGRAIDNAVSLPDGQVVRGVPEFGQALAKDRQADFSKTLCQKFLGYALGRSLQLSDQPLLDEMQSRFEKSGAKLSVLFELVAVSPQFRTQRGKDFTAAKYQRLDLK